MANPIFFLSGLISILAQTFLLRESQLIFHGNELSIGLIISIWLIGVAIGSYLTGKPPNGDKNKKLLAGVFSFCGIYVLVAFIFICNFRQLFGFLPGIALPIAYLICFSSAVFFPLGALIGSQFSMGMGLIDSPSFRAGKIYLWESLGYFAGGILFTFVILPYFNSVATIAFILQLSFLAAMILLNLPWLKTVTVLMLIAFCPVYLSSSKFELYMLSRVYCGYKLTAVKDTPYGQLAALMRAGETFFFSDGKPLETINAPNAEIVENNVILPMLFCDNPQTALLIGGAGRYAPAILSQGVKTLDYVEINPQLIDFVSKNKFVSPEIKIHYTDGVKFINNEPASLYDAVFVDVAYPLALSLNRYYTKEFFASLDKRLTKDGIVVISMPGSMAYIDRRLGGMNSVIFETLKSSFKYVKIIAGETYVYIATDSPISATEIVKRRFKKMGVHTDYLSDKYIDYKLDPVKENWVKAELEKNKSSIFGKITLNKEFYPAALFRSLLYWQSIFSPRTAGILQSVSNLIWLPIICIVMLILLSKQGYAAVSFSTGAAAMGLQMSAIWAIGALNGSVYYWIGLLNAFFMAGTGVGAFYAIQDSKLIIKNRIYQIEITLIAWIIVWYALISAIAVPWPIIFLLSLGSGALLGLQFPMLAESGSAPKIYAADVLGGCMAAIVGGAIIIPAWGLSGMFVMLFLLKAASVFGVWQDF